jgi:3-dehydroquinate synthase
VSDPAGKSTAATAAVLVSAEGASYTVHIGHGIVDGAGELIRDACGGGRRCALVTDSNVGPAHAGRLVRALGAAGVEPVVLTVPAGEGSKSFGCLERLCGDMAAAGLDRKSFVVGLGGGVVGDLSGFAAAVYLRGVPHAQVPTSLLAQVDSSVGGKTGINIPAGKNLVGAFHQPAVVVADTALLETLPPRAFREGMAECIKHGIIRDAPLVDEAAQMARDDLPGLVARNIAIKARVVAEDPFERSGIRALLNFGHTVGHAIEQAAGYGRFLHGEAIAIGMAAALRLSVTKAALPEDHERRALEALEAFDLPIRLPDDIPEEPLLEALARDKKFESGSIRFVLTSALGSAFVSDQISRDDILDAIRAIRGKQGNGIL